MLGTDFMNNDGHATLVKFGSAFDDCPESIRVVIEEVARETVTKAIWFIGSRANSSAKPSSDWDILVFCDDEPMPVQERHKGLDVLRVGPSGRVLLEGMSETFVCSFENFHWSLTDSQQASYVGLKLRRGEVLHDYDESRYDSAQLKAFLIYGRKS
jgi:hypothetical protein